MELGYIVREQEKQRKAERAHSDEHPDRRDLKQQAKANARQRFIESRKLN